MDFFLFQRYGLNEKETDIVVIEKALEEHKEKQGWEAKLQSKNDKIRSRAKEDKKRWSDDREILVDSSLRTEYLKEYYEHVAEIVEYILEAEEQEESFSEIAEIQGVTVETAKLLYEKYKESSSFDNPDLSDVQTLALKINKVQNSFNALTQKLDDSIKYKFSDAGINLSSLFEALNVDSCTTAEEIGKNSRKVSEISYELYNKQLFSSDIKNIFMDIFDPKSSKEESVWIFLQDKNLETYFKEYSWGLLKYIRTTCMLMKKTGVISGQKIAHIPASDRSNFANAMKKVFGVSFDVVSNNETQKDEEKNILPQEVSQGEAELKRGQFDKALSLFSKASSKDPYCWQAYWGMFKASVKAKSNDEVYFPGFIDLLKASEFSNSYPEYVDYYKNARLNAAAQRSKEINFATIEMEYKKADQANLEFNNFVDSIKENYDSADVNRIESAKGKEACQKMLDKNKEYNKYLKMDSEGNFLNICILISGIFIANFGIMFLPIEFIANNSISDFLSVVTLIAAGGLAWFLSESLLVCGITVGVVLGAFFLVDGLCESFWILRLIIPPLVILGGAVVSYVGIQKMKKVKGAGKKAEKIMEELNELAGNVTRAYIEEILIVYNKPIIGKYRVPFPTEKEINFNRYIEISES